MPMPKIFCEKGGPADWARGGEQAGALSYLGMIDCGWGSSMYYVMRDILRNDVNVNRRTDVLPIDICKLIANSDLV